MFFKSSFWLTISIGVASLSSASAATLGFDDALARALAQAPALAASARRLDAARQRVIPAAALPDPQLTLGLENIPVEGDPRFTVGSDPMSMRKIGVMQEIPNRAKRDARLDEARARADLAYTEAQVTRQDVLRETALAWIRRHTAEAQLARIADLYAENRVLAAAVRARLAGGGAAAAEAVLPREEAAQIAGIEDTLRARREQNIAELRRWVGDAAALPLEGKLPSLPVDPMQLAHRVESHPELAVYAPRTRVLDAEIGEARAAKLPDWRVGIAYQQRGERFNNMASVEVGFDLPLFTATRQTPRIVAVEAERAALDADYQTQLRKHTAELEADMAEYQRLDQALTRQRDVFVPLANEKMELALATWRGGQGSLTDLVAARRARIDADLKAIELAGARSEIAARLHFTHAQVGEAGGQP